MPLPTRTPLVRHDPARRGGIDLNALFHAELRQKREASRG